MPADGPHIARSFHSERRRPPWQLRLLLGGLTLGMAALIGIALVIMAGEAVAALDPLTDPLSRAMNAANY